MRTRLSGVGVGVASALVLAGCVVVRPPYRDDRPTGHGHHARGEQHAGFDRGERDAVRGYWGEHGGRRGCPPGLAKKHNGCLPPGQAKKRYAVGRPLPPGVVVYPLPRALEIRIGLPPPGYRYGIVDGDVVKLGVGTMLVVDAIRSMD
jgi:hypothetical protein